jgi:hypothetical protein
MAQTPQPSIGNIVLQAGNFLLGESQKKRAG